MNSQRISAVLIRHFYNLKRSWEKLSDSFYWPAMDLILWGLTSQYFQQAGQISNVVLILLSALVFWQVIWRSQYEITVSLLEELWSRNLVNLFASPLKLNEWIAAVLLLGLIKMVMTISFTFILTWILYSINLLNFGFLLLPFFGLLLFSGWWVGLLVAGIILRFGIRVQTLAWAGVYLLAPFSALYYPVASLPLWAQKIAIFIPTSYLFEGMREVLTKGYVSWYYLLWSLLLNLFYLFWAVKFFKASFAKACDQGLAKLDEG